MCYEGHQPKRNDGGFVSGSAYVLEKKTLLSLSLSPPPLSLSLFFFLQLECFSIARTK